MNLSDGSFLRGLWTMTSFQSGLIWGGGFRLFFATAYMLADLGIRGGGFFAAHPGEVEVTARYFTCWGLVGVFGLLIYLDTKGPAFWYHR